MNHASCFLSHHCEILQGCCETSLGTCLPLELIWKTPASPARHHAFSLLKPTGQGMFSFIWKRQVHN